MREHKQQSNHRAWI